MKNTLRKKLLSSTTVTFTNQITTPKEFIPLPQGEHLEIDGSHQAYYKRLNDDWLPALRDGRSVPPAKE